MIFIALLLALVGGALIETPIIGFIHGENGIGAIIFGSLCGLLFLVPGIIVLYISVKALIKSRNEIKLQPVLNALRPGFKEATTGDSFLDRSLSSFRNHYSSFLGKKHISENEAIQGDVTQIFRNILQLQRNRLDRLGLTCEMLVKRMKYFRENGVSTVSYSDGKYNILDVTEEVAAKTIYKKQGKEIYTKTDRDIANYTIIQAQTVGSDRIICPNCGTKTTRDALLDGCDYCGTKFQVEDLKSRIAVFAFRPDADLRYEKYKKVRNVILAMIIGGAVLTVFLGFTIYAFITGPDLLKEAGGGIILTVLGSIFAIIIATPFYILSFIIVYFWYFLLAGIVFGGISYLIAKIMKKCKKSPMLGRFWEKSIRDTDPQFSIANFYSGVQNKLSSIIFAETKEQLQAFAEGDLTWLFGKYSDVVGVDVENMFITNFFDDKAFQYMDVDASLILTRYNGKNCRVRREGMSVRLAKSIHCKTQVVCAPAVLRCKSCGASLDLLQGKHCSYCNHELDLINYDWVIKDIRTKRINPLKWQG